jgi:transcriptional regulator with XRE-family HTH domain
MSKAIHRDIHRRVALAVLELRTLLGLSQRQLADRSGLSPSTVGRVEHLQGPLQIDTLTQLAHGLGVPVERLLTPSRESVH